MLNWIGGLGIAFIVMIFLPIMRVGGMQFFRAEGFDTMGKVLPRAADIARSLLWVYVSLTAIIMATYLAIGMEPLDGVVNALATVATGGFSPSDASFSKYPGIAEYAGGIFMIASALPFVLYMQMVRGQPTAVLRDPQVQAFLRWLLVSIWGIALWKSFEADMPLEQAFRESFFNLSSIASGTGFFSGSYASWEGPAVVAAFALGFAGGCSGSSSGGLSVFRVQLTLAALAMQIRRIHSPNRVEHLRYAGRKVDPEVIDALLFFVTGYVLIIGLASVAMTMLGVDQFSAVMAAWQALGNIGYGYGPLVWPTGTFRDFPDGAIWIMSILMLMGRLGLLTMLVVLLPRFWRG